MLCRFDLSVPRDRITVAELINLASTKRGYALSRIEYTAERKHSKKFKIKLVRDRNPSAFL